ncbi:hypothetical protein P3S68_000154 [Capsicum galapagoense]
MFMIYTRRVIIILLIAHVAAAAADLEINEAEKTGGKTVISISNGSNVNEKLDTMITNSKKEDVKLDSDSFSSKMKPVEVGDRRKMNNSSERIGESANVGDQNKLDDSSAKKEMKEAQEQEKPKGVSSEKQEEKGKVVRDGIQSREVILPSRKESFHGEECDSLYSCTIDEKALVACLRVPGNESPDLSLLVQNKGKDTASISIMAPKFVKLEHIKIELQGKENKKMKVSIGNGGNDNIIILKAGDGQCSLDFRGLIDNADKTSQFNYAFLSFGIMCLVAIALVATVLMYIKRRPLLSNDHKYQKLDMGLPVSSGGKAETLSTDGWDNNWDDNWDDEEAPIAPSLPVTPSLSSKSVSTRWSSKEGWKD